MTYTALTRTIAGLNSGEIGSQYIGTPILFVIGGITYTGSIASIDSLTSIVLLISLGLPIADGTVTDITLINVSGYYGSQSDIEARISVKQLAMLTNDAAQPTQADGAVLNAIFSKVNTEIDSLAGQVWVTPFIPGTNCDSIPNLVKQIFIDYTIYYCFLRRFSTLEVPKQWVENYKNAEQKLNDISNMLVQLDGNPTVFSTEANMRGACRESVSELMRDF